MNGKVNNHGKCVTSAATATIHTHTYVLVTLITKATMVTLVTNAVTMYAAPHVKSLLFLPDFFATLIFL